ncbi:MAG: hypothetical protein KY467_13650 [Gemmatimonadetes bacterium]|nr:hypothetical protein [Gemmatimonadota bacterium]
MRKLKLELDQLAVDSFTTAAAGQPHGTVRGAGLEAREADLTTNHPTMWSCATECGETCEATCDPTCEASCYTCFDDTCNSCVATQCWTGMSPECCA